MRLGFEAFEHTADVGYAVRGRSLEELFANGALALYDAALSSLDRRLCGEGAVELQAPDLPTLFHDWLDELLFLLACEGTRVDRPAFRTLSSEALSCSFQKVHIPSEAFKTEIKAITYGELRVEQRSWGWEARVIFDV